MAEAKHQQRVIMLAPEPHQFPGDENGHQIAVDRAFERDILQPRDPEIERRLPRPPKPLRPGRAPQRIAIRLRHIDHRGGAADRPRIGKRRDKRPLPLGRPPVVPIFARHRRKIGKRRPSLRRDRCPVLHDKPSSVCLERSRETKPDRI